MAIPLFWKLTKASASQANVCIPLRLSLDGGVERVPVFGNWKQGALEPVAGAHYYGCCAAAGGLGFWPSPSYSVPYGDCRRRYGLIRIEHLDRDQPCFAGIGGDEMMALSRELLGICVLVTG